MRFLSPQNVQRSRPCMGENVIYVLFRLSNAVYRWNDFKQHDANYRVPTVVSYNANGTPRGFGYIDEADNNFRALAQLVQR